MAAAGHQLNWFAVGKTSSEKNELAEGPTKSGSTPGLFGALFPFST
jgi:hypothetical protein